MLFRALLLAVISASLLSVAWGDDGACYRPDIDQCTCDAGLCTADLCEEQDFIWTSACADSCTSCVWAAPEFETAAPAAMDGCDDTQGDWGFKTDCNYWASLGECESNPRWMGHFCPKSCNTCGVEANCIATCATSTAIELGASCGEEAVNDCLCPLYAGAGDFCGYTCAGGTWSIKCQALAPAPAPAPAPVTVIPCVDDNTMCQYWAKLTPSECTANPGYMTAHCAKSCGTCAT